MGIFCDSMLQGKDAQLRAQAMAGMPVGPFERRAGRKKGQAAGMHLHTGRYANGKKGNSQHKKMDY